jgi:hypothetical protein
MMKIGMFSFVNQFFDVFNNFWQCKGKLIDGNFLLQINNLSEGYNLMHFDQFYALAWLCRIIVRCKCIVMSLPHSSVIYVLLCIDLGDLS